MGGVDNLDRKEFGFAVEETGNLVNLLLMGNLPRKLEILSAQVPTFQFLASSLWSGVFISVKTSCNVALFCTNQWTWICKCQVIYGSGGKNCKLSDFHLHVSYTGLELVSIIN